MKETFHQTFSLGAQVVCLIFKHKWLKNGLILRHKFLKYRVFMLSNP